MGIRFLYPQSLKRPGAVFVLIPCLVAILALLPLVTFGTKVTWRASIILFSALLSCGVLARFWLAGLLRRYRRTREKDLVPFLPSVEVPVVSAILISVAALVSLPALSIRSWWTLNLLFDGAVLSLLGPGALAARKRDEPLASVAAKPDDQAFSLRDDPITSPAQDILDRDGFVTRWIEDMRSIDRGGAYIYGLFGRQGGGKTSVLNLLRARLESAAPGEFLRIDFDPWYFESQQAVTDGFYSTFDAAVNRHYLLPDLSRLLGRYATSIKTGIPWLHGAELSIKREAGLDIAVLKSRIRSVLERLPERLILIIDDLDRINVEDLATVLRLARLTCDFPNLLIILSCDPARLQPIAGDTQSTPALLQKTVQSVLTLAPASRNALDEYLYHSSGPADTPTRLSHTDQLFKEWGIHRSLIDSFEEEFSPYYLLEFRFGFQNLRDCKRYLTSLRFSLKNLWPEINLFDYFLLEYVKVFAHEVWLDMWENAGRWVGADLKRGFGLQAFALTADKKADLDDLKQHVDELLAGSRSRVLLLSILERLLPRVGAASKGEKAVTYSPTAVRELRLQSWEHFTKYFRQISEPGEIPNKDMEAFVTAVNGAATVGDSRDVVTAWLDKQRAAGQLKRFLEKLLIYRNDVPPARRPEIATAVAFQSDQFSLGGWRDSDSEFDVARHLTLTIIDELWRTEGRSLLATVVAEAPRLSFALVVLRYTHDTPGVGGFFAMRSPDAYRELRPVALKRITARYATAARDIFEDEEDNGIFVLVMWSNLGGREAAQGYLEQLIAKTPEYWARFAKAFLIAGADLSLRELSQTVDPAWFLALGEQHLATVEADRDARRVLEILRSAPLGDVKKS